MPSWITLPTGEASLPTSVDHLWKTWIAPLEQSYNRDHCPVILGVHLTVSGCHSPALKTRVWSPRYLPAQDCVIQPDNELISQEPANYSLLATVHSLPVCVNKVLLEHSYAHLHVLSMAAFKLQRQQWIIVGPLYLQIQPTWIEHIQKKKSRGCWHAHIVRSRVSASVLDRYRLLFSSFPKQ